MISVLKSAVVLTTMALFFYAHIAIAQGGRLFDDLYLVARVLVVSGAQNNPAVIEQISALEAVEEGLDERDIVVIHYHGRVLETLGALSLFDRDTRVLEERGEFRYVEGILGGDNTAFSLVLIGKDGGVKNRWEGDVVDVGDIFEEIDGMPMRQRQAVGR